MIWTSIGFQTAAAVCIEKKYTNFQKITVIIIHAMHLVIKVYLNFNHTFEIRNLWTLLTNTKRCWFLIDRVKYRELFFPTVKAFFFFFSKQMYSNKSVAIWWWILNVLEKKMLKTEFFMIKCLVDALSCFLSWCALKYLYWLYIAYIINASNSTTERQYLWNRVKNYRHKAFVLGTRRRRGVTFGQNLMKAYRFQFLIFKWQTAPMCKFSSVWNVWIKRIRFGDEIE